MSIPLKALIFDYGQVLCQPQQPSDIRALAGLLEAPIAEFEKAYWQDRLLYDEGRVDGSTYWKAIAERLNRSVNDAEVGQLSQIDMESWCRPDEVMVDFARRARTAGLRTGLLSNMHSDLRVYLASSVGWLPPFDHLTFSCDVKIVKPDHAIYRHCLEGLGVAPAEALFLDDRPENVAAAHEVGLHSFVFTTPAAAAEILEANYNLPVRIEY